MFGPPGITFAGRSVHGPLHLAEEWWLSFTRAIALPDVRAVAVHFLMKRVVDGDFVVAVVVYSISEQLKPHAMPRPIVAPRMPPRGRDEEVSVYGFMQQRIYCVTPRTVLQQRRAQLQTNACELVCCRIL